ncbi:MAG: peptidyl-prolyl cis-trans isomerase, EpsD family [Thiobacillus sp. 63-78]|uniref:EpsD family peptidyl-prolyl cis-trans isomerase n=1 Tax=Thiobacillus sp. 63-78 TaxID=1895859 RepID=UPI0009616766|nr:EpsD family peptidyl-prolyl cis-trans isomerase [Thiobacillus sp. 63-78]MBN8764382.1 EpsD family peptidyl-prolyl cis-trans isomerase [Thiobacillus sp.]OJZ09883.1 MAG: peptidyl-prolyl cis-trans isomerase, EpsD family [Thiobacillus sp. 63-78]
MHGLKKLYLPLLIVALMAGCGDKKGGTAEESKPTQVAAKVNGTELTVSQVNYALQRIPNLDKEQSKAASLQVIRNLVDQEVLAQKAQSEKLDRDPVVVQALDAARRQIMAEVYMTRKLGAPAEPTDAEVSDYFNKHPELFTKRKIYRLQELAIKAPEEKQEAIRKQLTDSRTLNDFAEWLKAEKYPAKASQEVKPAEQLPQALLPRLAEMPDGQAMVVKTPDGLLVIVLADSQVQPVTLEQAKPAIARLLQNEARQKAAKAELDKVKAEAKIEYMGEFADAGKEPAAAATAGSAAEPAAAPAAPAADADAISKGVSGLK